MKVKKHKLNGEVRFDKVRVVGAESSTIMSSLEAYRLAKESGDDLVLINENADPPIVKIENYKKFLYDQEKREKENRRASKKNDLKEIQLSTNIGDHDFNTKCRKAEEFLKDGDKVKYVLVMKGRENARPDQSEIVVLKFVESLQEVGSPEYIPRREGKKWYGIIKPKK